MTNMTKRIQVWKNTTGNHEQDAEGVLCIRRQKRNSRETYWKDTRHTECLGHYRNCNGKRTMEEIPPSTWEQVLQHPSPERREVTGESSSHTERAQQQEVTNKSPTDHTSDQENEEDEDNSSEVNHKDDRVEFIKEFQDFMNEAIK